MNKKFWLICLMIFVVGIVVVSAQESPMSGMYITNDSSARFKYITIDGDRDSSRREIKFYDDTGHNVLYTVTGIFINRPKFEFLGQETGWEVRQH